MSDKIAAIQRNLALREVLRRYTPARVSLRTVGPAIATRDQLRFQLDHALARDAVHARLDVQGLLGQLRAMHMEAIPLRSAVPEESEVSGRQAYLRRPDLGRCLHPESAQTLREFSADSPRKPGVVFVIVDGLSALAVERHALPLLGAMKATFAAEQWSVGPACVVSQGRVAIGDEIGSFLKTSLTVVLIGERPGLSSPDSLGAYITWDPHPGRTDAERNCVSNIRHEGLSYDQAAMRIAFYMNGARRLRASGVGLKENIGLSPPTQ